MPKPEHKSKKPVKKRKIDLFGLHAVRAAWDNPARHVHALYATQTALQNFDLGAGSIKRPQPTILSKEELERSLPPGAVHQGLALTCQPLEEVALQDIVIASSKKQRSVVVMLDQVTDPHNVGAILRSACAFSADGLILQRKHAPSPTLVLAKTACGAVEYVPIAYETNLSRSIDAMQKAGYFVIGLDERGEKTPDELPSYEKSVLVLGAEGAGLRPLIRDRCDILARLPTTGPIQSLNVSNAAAVALYALTRPAG